MMSLTDRLATIAAGAAFLSIVPLLALTDDWVWLAPAAIAIGVVIGLGHLLRRARVPAPIVHIVQPLALVYWLGVLVASDVAWFGFVPNTAWADRMATTFQQGIDAITEQKAPIAVDDHTGVLLLLVGGAGVVAWLVDILITAFSAPVLAGAPLGACYVVTAIVENGQVDWYWFIPPAAGYLALLITDRRARVMAWGRSATTSRRRGGVPQADSLVKTGRKVGAVALTGAIAIPAALPVLAEGLIPGGSGEGGGNVIRTNNPILDIKDNLDKPDDAIVATFKTNERPPNYLRMSITDEFDGEQWTPSKREVPLSHDVANGLPEPPGLNRDRIKDVEEVSYDITITEGAELNWLPIPYPPTNVDVDSDWRYDAATLDIVHDPAQSDFSYTVDSLDIEPTFEELKAAGDYPDELKPLTKLPDNFSPSVAKLAQNITKGASSDIERAQKLQAFFSDSGGKNPFIYDDEVDLRQSADAMEQFLKDRRGFCVQFATTMTAMARSLDIPARVAIGFVRSDRENGQYVVRANDAHAWPELYFEGAGWVRFEPTPGRPGTIEPSWSDAPIESDDDTNEPTTDPSASASPPARPDLPEDRGGAAPTGGTGFDATSQGPQIALAVAGVAALLVTPRGVAWMRRIRRWRRAGDNASARAEAAWSDLREAARDARLTWNDADTPRMIGHRIAAEGTESADDRDLLKHIVTTTERARYSRHAPDEPVLHEDSTMLRRDLLRSRPMGIRILAFMWPAALRDLGTGITTRGSRVLDWFDGLRAAVRTRVFRRPE